MTDNNKSVVTTGKKYTHSSQIRKGVVLADKT